MSSTLTEVDNVVMQIACPGTQSTRLEVREAVSACRKH